jgi:YfiH family protein
MGALFLTSRRLPVPHGFSTREGGVSEGPYASLNLSATVGDGREQVEENLRRLCEAGRVAGIVTVSQVHGDRVLDAPPELSDGLAPVGEADALWTATPGQAVGVRTADCVPVLLVDPDRRQVVAVHSGWRGTKARIAARAVERLVRGGARPERLLAAIGPCIRACCYAVSEELAGTFEHDFGGGAVVRAQGQPRLELVFAVEQTLRASGVREVELVAPCTHCDAERFFSHRRDRGITGRHLSFVACAF